MNRRWVLVFAVVLLAGGAVSFGDAFFDPGNLPPGGQVIFDNGQGDVGVILTLPLFDVGTIFTPVTDPNLEDNLTWVQFDKIWREFIPEDPRAWNGKFDLPAGIPWMNETIGLPLLSLIVLPPGGVVGADHFDVVLTDEQLMNKTGVVWKDFHIIVLGGHVDDDGQNGDMYPARVELLGTLVPGGRLPTLDIEQFPVGLDGTTLNALSLWFHEGEWPSDGRFGTLFQGAGGDPATLRIGLDPDLYTIVLVKEFPTIPEPATMSLLALGGCSAAAAAAKRRPRGPKRPRRGS